MLIDLLICMGLTLCFIMVGYTVEEFVDWRRARRGLNPKKRRGEYE